MFVFKITDDSDPVQCTECCYPTEEQANAIRDELVAAYPTWTIEAVREEPPDFEPVQFRYKTPVKDLQG